MKQYQFSSRAKTLICDSALLALWIGAFSFGAIQRGEASPNVALWDTAAALTDNAALENRTSWKAVPSDLLRLEADPPKARSDPGYYGREYVFKGDAVVESPSLRAVFWSAKGRVLIYAREQNNEAPGKKLLEVYPLDTTSKPAIISRLTVRRNTGDELDLEASFSAEGAAEVSEEFVFDKTGVVEIKPAQSSKGIGLSSEIACGVVPSFIGDDLIYNAADYPAAKALSVPSESFFLGLLQGEANELVMTWPKGKQQLALHTGNDQAGAHLIESIDFSNDGQSLYLALLGATGIWHKESLKPTYLEKDVAIQWTKPFPAKWKTQLTEAGVKTTFTFKEDKEDIWRGVPGSYTYPVWFNGDAATFHLSKKVPPRGESFIYFLEPQDTPLSVSTPVDILKETLGRAASESILDPDGRQLSTHHRRGGDGVRRACTCGCTEAIQKVFEAQEEVAKNDYVAGAVDDMIYFVHRHVERINQYRTFVAELIQLLEASKTSEPDLKPYLDNLEQIAGQIPKEYSVQEENMKSFDYADNLAKQTIALTSKKDPNNLQSYLELGNAWRGMGGAQDYVLAQCHAITRKLCQEAGYGCIDHPKAVALAEEIRARCRQCLRNPDGYEIWADY